MGKKSRKFYFRVGILQKVIPWLNMQGVVSPSYIMLELAKWLKKVLPFRVSKLKLFGRLLSRSFGEWTGDREVSVL